jgi:hypothetical protein
MTRKQRANLKSNCSEPANRFDVVLLCAYISSLIFTEFGYVDIPKTNAEAILVTGDVDIVRPSARR